MTEALVILLIALLFLIAFFASEILGYIGEKKVAFRLWFLSSKRFKVIHNILLPYEDKSSQIDHVVVSLYGIFVIETKNYRGWIHGHEKSEYWTQTFYKSKTKFRNPVSQNKGHVRALKQVLNNYPDLIYYPIVVFSGRAELKNVYTEVPVIYKSRLLRTIRRKKGNEILTIEEVDQIIKQLKHARIKGRKGRKKHIRQIKKHISKQKKRVKNSLCPRCGEKLVLREGQYGKFWGCASYPICRYTKKLS
ncbi:MAG: NERD domain-containing protein [Bacteroidota bacterium]